MSTNHLYHQYLKEIIAGYASCQDRKYPLAIQHLNTALGIAKQRNISRVTFDIEYWIEQINQKKYSYAGRGMQSCINATESLKLLLDPPGQMNELFHRLTDCITSARNYGIKKHYKCAISFLTDAETIAHDNQCYEISTNLRLIIAVLEGDGPEDAMIHLITFSKTLHDLKRLLDSEGN